MGQTGALVVVLAAIAVPLMAYTVVMLLRQRRRRGWQPVPGTVVRSWLAEGMLPGTENGVPVWFVRVVYDYVWQGQALTGAVVHPDPVAYRLTSRRRALRHLARWPAGAAVTVYVAPDGQAALTIRVPWERMSHYLATGLGGALALGLALFVHFALR